VGRAVHRAVRRGKRLIDDDRFRAELELCDRWGIPHSQFIGAGDGRWTPRDREKALAYRAYLRTVCPQCGTRHDEWDHGGPDEEDRYVAVGQRCIGCQVIADKQQQLEQQGVDLHGMKVGLMPVAVHAAMEAEKDLRATRRGPRRWDDEDDD
jgi:hypothetical protein